MRLVENVLKLVPIHSVQGITKCHLLTEHNHRLIQTEGQNVAEIWKRHHNFDMRKFLITDVHEFMSRYGVSLSG